MHHSNNSDFKNLLVSKKLKNYTPVDHNIKNKAPEFLAINKVEKILPFDGASLQKESESSDSLNQFYSREPEYIETDFTTPLAEISRPVSLDAVGGELLFSDSRSYLGVSKRPYSANQVHQQNLMSKSQIHSGLPDRSVAIQAHSHHAVPLISSGYQHWKNSERSYSQYGKGLSQHFPAASSFQPHKPAHSQRSSLIQNFETKVRESTPKFVSILPKTGYGIMPNRLPTPSINQPKTVLAARVNPSVKNIPKSCIFLKSDSVMTSSIPEFSLHPFDGLSSSFYSTRCDKNSNSSAHVSPLNLSSKSLCGKRQDNLRLPSVNLFSDAVCSTNSDIQSFSASDADFLQSEIYSKPLNLISKRREVDASIECSLPTDLSIQSHRHNNNIINNNNNNNTRKVTRFPSARLCYNDTSAYSQNIEMKNVEDDGLNISPFFSKAQKNISLTSDISSNLQVSVSNNSFTSETLNLSLPGTVTIIQNLVSPVVTDNSAMINEKIDAQDESETRFLMNTVKMENCAAPCTSGNTSKIDTCVLARATLNTSKTESSVNANKVETCTTPRVFVNANEVETCVSPHMFLTASEVEDCVVPHVFVNPRVVETSVVPPVSVISSEVETCAVPHVFVSPREVETCVVPRLPVNPSVVETSVVPQVSVKGSEVETSVVQRVSVIASEVQACVIPRISVHTSKVEICAGPSAPSTLKNRKEECFTNFSASQNSAEILAFGQECDDVKFVWDDYLESCHAIAAPSDMFKHVECSLQNGLKKGMFVEVSNKDPVGTYWVASIVMSCGQLLMLKPSCCPDDTSLNFWRDMLTCELHQIGWCASNNKTICPPKEIANKVLPDWETILQSSLAGAVTPPLYMLDMKTGSLPFDQIHVAMLFEVEHEMDPNRLWFARVVENIGGRLLLHMEGDDSSSNDFWMFYIDRRLHYIGWSREHGRHIFPPPVEFGAAEIFEKQSESYWEELSRKCFLEATENSPPLEIFKDQEEIIPHGFTEGWRLELLDISSSDFKVVHVSKVINEFYFILEEDFIGEAPATSQKWCCHSTSSNIFPAGWCKKNNISLLPVSGYDPIDDSEFDWENYLRYISSSAAPDNVFQEIDVEAVGFVKDMKLEAIDRRHPDQICVATIEDVKEHLLWIRLDHDPSYIMVVPYDSHEIFPIGWCESNNYQLKAPVRKSLDNNCDDTSTNNHSVVEAVVAKDVEPKRTSGWCPKIYFNTKCYSGPFLSKCRLHLLPKSIGPGSMVPVMTAVLDKLIASAYKSSRVLRELQLEGDPCPGMEQHIFRTKYDTKTYSATVEVCTSSNQVEKFCKDACRRLLCCPNLISAHCYPSICPENCLKIAKSKHFYHFGERRRQIGRPRGGHSNIERVPPTSQKSSAGRKKRKHKKKLLLTLRKKHGGNMVLGRTYAASETGASSSEKDIDDVATVSSFSDVTERIGAASLGEVSDNSIPEIISNKRPRETLKKLKLVCNQDWASGNRSYVVCNDSMEFTSQKRVGRKRKRRGKSEDGPSSSKKMKDTPRKYDVQTRGISLTKNYLFERKTHKKIYIIPPTPPVNQSTSQLSKSIKFSCSASATAPFQTNASDEKEFMIKLTSNPAEWTVQQVVDFIKTTDSAKLARIFKDQEIDGKSFLLLTLPTVQECIEPKLGPAVKLCDLVERLKRAFFCQYATTITV